MAPSQWPGLNHGLQPQGHGGGWGKHWGQRAAGDREVPPPWAVVLYPGISGGERVSREGAGPPGESTGSRGLPEMVRLLPRGQWCCTRASGEGDECPERGPGPAEHSVAHCSLQPWA